jgi:hypothetical protein
MMAAPSMESLASDICSVEMLGLGICPALVAKMLAGLDRAPIKLVILQMPDNNVWPLIPDNTLSLRFLLRLGTCAEEKTFKDLILHFAKTIHGTSQLLELQLDVIRPQQADIFDSHKEEMQMARLAPASPTDGWAAWNNMKMVVSRELEGAVSDIHWAWIKAQRHMLILDAYGNPPISDDGLGLMGHNRGRSSRARRCSTRQ